MNEEIVRPQKPPAPNRLSGASARSAFRSRLVAWFKKNGRDLPWRHTRDPYAILVSEMMLQQTQVATVIGYFSRWMQRFPDFAALASASEAEVLHAWQGLGYYSRARNLHRAARIVITEHEGQMPHDLDAIRALPGIGRYTAGAVATFSFDHSTPILDANIARVLTRLFDEQTPVDTANGQAVLWSIAEDLQPKKGAGVFNEALMELGALLCTPRQPKCLICPVRAFCQTKNPECLPVKKPRRKTVALTDECAFITRGGKVLLEQETGNRWRGLWKLPSIENRNSKFTNHPLLQLTYPFTHHRITLKVFAGKPPKRIGENQCWFDSAEGIPMPSPHRRALRQLLGSTACHSERGEESRK